MKVSLAGIAAEPRIREKRGGRLTQRDAPIPCGEGESRFPKGYCVVVGVQICLRALSSRRWRRWLHELLRRAAGAFSSPFPSLQPPLVGAPHARINCLLSSRPLVTGWPLEQGEVRARARARSPLTGCGQAGRRSLQTGLLLLLPEDGNGSRGSGRRECLRTSFREVSARAPVGFSPGEGYGRAGRGGRGRRGRKWKWPRLRLGTPGGGGGGSRANWRGAALAP